MIERIVESAFKNTFLVFITFVLITLYALWTFKDTSLDALPDLSQPQVILEVKWPGQSPQNVEEQVSFTLTQSLMSLAGVEDVRAFNAFGYALVYVLFEDDTDIYWARSRISEELSQLTSLFPKGVSVALGPDATGIGWVYQYALTSQSMNLQELRSLQDTTLCYGLLSLDGISEVATVGGFEKSYQVSVNQDTLVQYGISLKEIIGALERANLDVGANVIQRNGFEQIVQARGLLQTAEDIESITIISPNGIPLQIENFARVEEVPLQRRGVADLNGQGEVVGGIVVVRYGENAYNVLQSVKAKLTSLVPKEVTVTTVYDRAELIEKAVDTLKTTLIKEVAIVIVIVLLFLWHFRSALVIAVTLPLSVLYTFLFMNMLGIPFNIMSLGGIAIAIGAVVDASIVMVENVNKKLSIQRYYSYSAVVEATKEVAGPIFFALMVITVSFIPIFALNGQEGRLFTPLAYTKTFAMAAGALISITLVPVLIAWFIKSVPGDEIKNPINRVFLALYRPLLLFALKARWVILGISVIVLGYSAYLYTKQKWEFMPMFNEETIMYMPVTPSGISVQEAKYLTQLTDKILYSFPEVEKVFGKAGRSDSATDPAPLSMIETFITLKPKEFWREGVSYDSLLKEMDESIQIPGLVNSWTYPIRGRIDMLLSGIRTPMGIKVYGFDETELERITREFEVRLTRQGDAQSVFAERINRGYYLNIDLNETALSRYGVSKSEIMDILRYGVGGAEVTEMLEGVENYPITVRFEEEQRNSVEAINNLMVKTALGYHRLNQFAVVYHKLAPSVIKTENGMKVAYLYITPKSGLTSQAYKENVTPLLKSVDLPAGYYYEWAGQSQYLESALKKLSIITPMVLLLIFIFIYLALKRIDYALMVFLTLPFSLLGGLLFIDWLDYNLSVAVIVGFLALLGVAAETSIVMMIYLENALKEHLMQNRFSSDALKKAVIEGAVMRLRPKMMTVISLLAALFPILYSSGVGAEVMQRIAAPMIGGMVSSAFFTLIGVPVLFYMRNKGLKVQTE